jgi:alcohol dehydrogenase (cytochrome c)
LKQGLNKCLQRLAVTGFATAAIFSSGSFGAESVVGLNDGIFSSQQVKSGKRLYKKYCKSCHEGDYFGPVLLAWQGEQLSSFFDVMTAAMPENDPGSLEQEQYTDLLAFILKISGYPQDTRSLDPGTAEFAGIVIEKPLH